MFHFVISVGFNPINSKLFLGIRVSISIIKYLPKYYPPSKSINQSYIISIIDLLEAVVPSPIQNFDSKLKESMTKKWFILEIIRFNNLISIIRKFLEESKILIQNEQYNQELKLIAEDHIPFSWAILNDYYISYHTNNFSNFLV
jgi:hypothetical protein